MHERMRAWLQDCFPICLIRAVEAVGLAASGGDYIETKYCQLMAIDRSRAKHGAGWAGPEVPNLKEGVVGKLPQDEVMVQDALPVNTHGGLLGFGAPWEVPAMYAVIEAVEQLRGEAEGRQLARARSALVYGNGGVFSAAAVAILRACATNSRL